LYAAGLHKRAALSDISG